MINTSTQVSRDHIGLNKTNTNIDLATKYYSQRASEPGTLLITEGTIISPYAGGDDNIPGCYNDDQIASWAKIVAAGMDAFALLNLGWADHAVHAKGSYIYMQLWALGRCACANILQTEGGYPAVSASDIPLHKEGKNNHEDQPRPLTIDEIKDYVDMYAQVAKNFVFGAGGDGVEIHGANGSVNLYDSWTTD
jgi:NADPH2 dehydrogenase